jgi:nickel transport system permease protein
MNRLLWKKVLADPLALICLCVIAGVILAGLFAPWIAPHDPLMPHLSEKFAPWSRLYPLGSDHLGRCIASRLIYGVRTTLFLAMAAMAMTIVLGVFFGLIAGLFDKAAAVILRVCDVMLSFPSELLMLAVVGMLGVGIQNILIAAVVAKVAWYTRMIYAFSLKHREQNYILFSRAVGMPSFWILRKHLLRTMLSDIAMLASLDAGGVILSISALSFLGLGVQAPTPEWGMMLSEAKNVLSIAPWQMLPSGFMIVAVVAAFHFLGDSLRDALDPFYFSSCKENA